MKNKTKSYYLDDNEILYRCSWMAWRIFNKVLTQFQMWDISNWIRDDRCDPTYLPKFSLYLTYSTHRILDKICNQINTIHKDNDENWKLYISYSVCFSVMYKEFYKKYLEANDDINQDFFDDLFEKFDMISDDEEEEYRKFWCIKAYTDYSGEIGNIKFNNDYNTEKFFVYYLSKMVNVVNKDTVLRNLHLYKNIGAPYFDDAFFKLPLEKIKVTLWSENI